MYVVKGEIKQYFLGIYKFRLSKQEIREFIAEACEFTNIGNEIESQFF